MSEYSGLTQEICDTVYDDLIEPVIARAVECGIIDTFGGTIVVTTVGAQNDWPVYVRDVYAGHPDVARFHEIALNKAKTAMRHGMSTRELQQMHPHLLRPGEVKWGGACVIDGLVVAFSGQSQEYDEMLASMMASAIIATCRTQMKALMLSDSIYVGS